RYPARQNRITRTAGIDDRCRLGKLLPFEKRPAVFVDRHAPEADESARFVDLDRRGDLIVAGELRVILQVDDAFLPRPEPAQTDGRRQPMRRLAAQSYGLGEPHRLVVVLACEDVDLKIARSRALLVIERIDP